MQQTANFETRFCAVAVEPRPFMRDIREVKEASVASIGKDMIDDTRKEIYLN